MMLDGKIGDSVYFPAEDDAFDAPLLVESRDKTLSTSGARKLLAKCRNGLDDIRSALHTSSAWRLQTLGEDSFSGSVSESSESSGHSATEDPSSCSTKNFSDPPRSSAKKADQKLMRTSENASFLEDSSDSYDSFAGTDEDTYTAQTSADGDCNDGGVLAERSFTNFVDELEDSSDSSASESGLLDEGGASSGILQLTFNVGGGCTLSNLESVRPDDSNTTETSPKRLPPRRSSSCNEKIPSNQQSSRKDSNVSQARINNFPVDASPDRRLFRSKSNDVVLPSRKSQLSDNSEKPGRKLRRSNSADKLIGGCKTLRRRDSSDKTNLKSGRECLKTSSIDRRPWSPSADHSDGKLSRRYSTEDKLTVRTIIGTKIGDGSDNEPDKDDLEAASGRRRSCQNSVNRRPRRRAEVARVLQPASSFNEKVAERSVRRLPARAASSRCLISSRSEHSLGPRLSAREESSSPFNEKWAERPPVRRLPARVASSRSLMSSRSEHLRGPRLSAPEECADHSKLIRVAPFQQAGRLQRAQSLRTVVDPSGSSARLYAPEIKGL
jgi:hypothetical protein